MKKNYRTRLVILIILLVGLYTLHKLGFSEYISVAYLQRYAETAKDFVSDYYWRSVITFIILLASLVALSIPAGILIPIIGGFLFGWLPGALYANIGATIGATLSFLSARYFIGDYIHEHFTSRLNRFNKELRDYGYLYLLGLHFFPITPFFLLNILAGATNISLWTFIWTTIAGVTPAYLIYSYIGVQLINIYEFDTAISAKILIAFVVLKVLSLTTLFLGRFGNRIRIKKS